MVIASSMYLTIIDVSVTTGYCVSGVGVFPPGVYGKGAICPLKVTDLGEAGTIHKGHSDSYCKVK